MSERGNKIPLSASIGVYDGIHAGHRAVLAELLKCPAPRKVFVFFKNPNKAGNIVTSAAERKLVLRKMGIEPLMLKIEQYWKMDARAFLEDILVKKYNVRCLVVGGDFVFGRRREGRAPALRKWAKEMGLELKVVKTKSRAGRKISTTLIKKLIAQSKTGPAAALMGRPYKISGRKVKGRGIAGTLGFPTINLIAEKSKTVPAGVFAAEVICSAGRFKAVVNSGAAPTFGIKKVFEFHLLEGVGRADVCSKFTVEFGAFIRKSKKFATREALIERIKKDVEIARNGNRPRDL